MASPAKAPITPPDTLPGDFFEKQQAGGPPETLPEDFDFGQGKTATPPNTIGAYHGGLTEIRPNQSDTLPHALEDTFSNIGAGGLGTLATLGRVSPWGALADHLQGKPTIYEDAYQAVTHPKDTGMGLVHAIKDVVQHPLENAAGAIGAAGAGAMLPEGLNLAAKVPSKTRAASTLNKVAQTVGKAEIPLTRTLPELENAQRLTLWGHGNITPLNSLYDRINTVNPLDFEEARGRYSPLTRLVAADKMNATPQLQSAAKKVAHALKDDIGDVATQHGVGNEYTQGMKEYHQAARNAEVAKKVAKWGGGALAGAVGLEGAHRLVNALR